MFDSSVSTIKPCEKLYSLRLRQSAVNQSLTRMSQEAGAAEFLLQSRRLAKVRRTIKRKNSLFLLRSIKVRRTLKLKRVDLILNRAIKALCRLKMASIESGPRRNQDEFSELSNFYSTDGFEQQFLDLLENKYLEDLKEKSPYQ